MPNPKAIKPIMTMITPTVIIKSAALKCRLMLTLSPIATISSPRNITIKPSSKVQPLSYIVNYWNTNCIPSLLV